MERKLEITEPKHGWAKLIIRGQEPFEGDLSYIQNLRAFMSNVWMIQHPLQEHSDSSVTYPVQMRRKE